MKKSLMIIAAAAAALAILYSCDKEEKTPEQNNESTPEENVVPSEVTPGDGIFTLTVVAPETKTVFGQKDGDSYPKKWVIGDKINVNGHESLGLEAGDGAGSNTATFRFTEDISIPAGTYSVVYPASAYSVSGVTIPATQDYVTGSFDPKADIILGYGTNPSAITLSNAVAYLKINVQRGDYGHFGIKDIKLTASGKKLNGTFPINESEKAITIDALSDASESVITLNVGGVEPVSPIPFLIALAPQTLNGGFTVTLTDMKGNEKDITKSSSASLVAGQILSQPAFKFQEFFEINNAATLLAFADSCSNGSENYFLITANIDMDGKNWPAAGTADEIEHAFNGVLDGGNGGTENGGFKISHLTSTTGAFINNVYNGTVKNVTLDNTCSISHAGDAKALNYLCVGMVGLSRGNTSYCFNSAPVSCSSTYDSDTRLYVGGVVGRQFRNGTISHCYNYATIDCTAAISSGDAAGDVYIGGIVASLERPDAGNNALIEYCTNSGAINASPAKESFLHVAGVAGKIESVNGVSDDLTITNLINTGDVIKNNTAQKNDIAILVAGLIGGIHGSSISSKTNHVVVENSYVSNCTIQNGAYNNSNGYGTASHTGGMFGVVRGVDTEQNIDIRTNCYVNNVSVICRRGYAGGLSSWLRGTTVDGCQVLNSSVKGSLAQCWHAGGISGYIRNSVIKNCDATLTKDAQYSLYTYSKDCNSGGIVGYVTDACSIQNCRANVELMYQGTANKEGHRGWIAGFVDESGKLTINKCGIRGTYGKNTASFTITSENYNSNIYGSDSAGTVTVGTGLNACYYWDGTL